MAARSKARKRALDVLYAAEMRGEEAPTALERFVDEGKVTNDYTSVLVRGVHENRAEIDKVLGSYAQGWTLERMPAVDRNALRLGIYEIMHADDIPDEVAISEAVALVRQLSTDESPAFVNGVLDAIRRGPIAAE